jgi:hypothetical protein
MAMIVVASATSPIAAVVSPAMTRIPIKKSVNQRSRIRCHGFWRRIFEAFGLYSA